MSEKLREALLNCPFCGSKAVMTQPESAGGNGRMIWIVGCYSEDCDVRFPGHARKVDATTAWNTRAALTSAPSPWVEIKSEGLPKVDGMYPVRDYEREYRLVRFDSARQPSREYWEDAILHYIPTPIQKYKEPK